MGTWLWTPLSAHRLCFSLSPISLSPSLPLKDSDITLLAIQPSELVRQAVKQPRIKYESRPPSKRTKERCSQDPGLESLRDSQEEEGGKVQMLKCRHFRF